MPGVSGLVGGRHRNLVVYIDGLPRLLVWAERADDDAPKPGSAGVVDVTDFGAHGNGRHLATDAITRAIAAVPKNGVLYFPPGVFLTGTISLKSDMTLYLASGARILGSPLRDHLFRPALRAQRVELHRVSRGAWP